MVRLTPTAVRVPAAVCVLEVPSGREPKLGKAAGEMLSPAPVPESPSDGRLFEALLVNDSVPETAPTEFGANETANVALCPEEMVVGKTIPERTNPAPESVSFVIVTSPLVAVRVPICCALLLPTLTVLKAKLEGLTVSCPADNVKFTPL